MEDKEANPPLLPNHNTTNTTTAKEDFLRKPIGGGSVTAAGAGDKVKRDEWSEGAVSTLLDAYEAKWVLRNRAKLKGQDWEDIAKNVSSRANSTKSPKTQTQCKNKIESMKKRYRLESASFAHDASSSNWPLYSRLDLLLRGTGPAPLATAAAPPSRPPHRTINQPMPREEPSWALSSQPPPLAALPPLANEQNSHGSNDRLAKEDGFGTKSCEHENMLTNTDSSTSTPVIYSEKEELRYYRKRRSKKKMDKNKRGRRKEEIEIGESMKWLAQVVVRSEQARMETMKEIERMRVEAEAKRGEMDLKRTEIIANTQLEIARIFASVNNGSVDSSLRIGRT